MTYRKLSILAAAVTLGLSLGIGAQTPAAPTAPPPVSTPPAATPPDTVPPVGTTSDPMDPISQSAPTTSTTHGDTVSNVARDNRNRHLSPGQITSFSELDSDGDGFIASLDLDTDSPIRDRFDELDLDNDSKLSRSEYESWVAQVTAPPGQTVSQIAQGQRDFRSLDSNNDGFVARTDVEVGSDLATNFDQYDLDNDSRLSRTEFDAWLAASVEASTFDTTAGTATDTMSTDTPTSTDATVTVGTVASATDQKSFSEIDSNSDGLLTKSELLAVGSTLAADLDEEDSMTRSDYEKWVAETDDEEDE